jgi:hypothetical protein
MRIKFGICTFPGNVSTRMRHGPQSIILCRDYEIVRFFLSHPLHLHWVSKRTLYFYLHWVSKLTLYFYYSYQILSKSLRGLEDALCAQKRSCLCAPAVYSVWELRGVERRRVTLVCSPNICIRTPLANQYWQGTQQTRNNPGSSVSLVFHLALQFRR